MPDRGHTKPPDDEPIGIIISRGSRAEPPPRFAAYVWSQVADAAPLPADSKAA